MDNRYEVAFFIQAQNCNPNGDPDMGNLPRIDPETNIGYITDVAIKRKIRDYIDVAFNGKDGMKIIKQAGENMNIPILQCAIEANDGVLPDKKSNTGKAFEVACKHFFDVRTFGDVLSSGVNAGQGRGPVQIAFANSIDPITPVDTTITRVCYTKDVSKGTKPSLEEYQKIAESMDDDEKRTMGRKQFVPYGLYVVKMSISANLADKAGFTEDDLQILFEAIMNMYNNGASSSKMGMTVLSPMIIFKHVGTDVGNEEQRIRATKLGCVAAHKLFDLIKITRKEDVEYARNYTDYDATIDLSHLPTGVQVGFKYGPFEDIVWDTPNDSWLKTI